MKSMLAKYSSRSGNKSGRSSPEHSIRGKLRRNDSAPGFLPSSKERLDGTRDPREPVLGVLRRSKSSNRMERETGQDSSEHSDSSERQPAESNPEVSAGSSKRTHSRRNSEPSRFGRKRGGKGLVAESGVATYRAEPKTVLLRKHHTADPSARVINGRLYVIASHDIQTRKNTGPGWKEGTRRMHLSKPRRACSSFHS